jgi:hypothetical protein
MALLIGDGGRLLARREGSTTDVRWRVSQRAISRVVGVVETETVVPAVVLKVQRNG